MNLGAMQVMFKLMGLNGAHIDAMARFYFRNQTNNGKEEGTNVMFKNPKYLSILNHLRFSLPEM
ncbi:hypothetical protein CUMW_111290 [Citrus unshiu]|nr:hypothetical protein CUMW_111290 [Citrus unshiu]